MSTDTPTPLTAHVARAAVTEYVTCRAADLDAAGASTRSRGIRGAEVFMADLKPRTSPLAATPEEHAALLATLRSAGVRRIHSSYWAAPTSFVGNVQFGELVERFDGTARVREYFGDLTGAHMFSRWRDEYALARELGADAYVFHLIDYMPVDGAWEFTVDRRVVLDAMIVLTQQFLRVLDEHGLMDENSPVIELENAGWGLEFGAQTADDFVEVFARVYDPARRLRVGWDLNHLLHAVGLANGNGAFLLPDAELTQPMRELERAAAGSIRDLSTEWIARNVCDERLIDRVSALHVSDCVAKTVEYFRNGVLDEAHAIDGTWEARQAEGLRIVLEHYDNHVCLGDGVLEPADVRELIDTIALRHPVMVLHELKNASDVWAELDRQRERLWGTRQGTEL
ncbi:hypothetical protein EV379_1727 [Microterricola gilva]|uniref:Xylose isomerase-like TIM barrel protein n=1 Tax=Microterricola gilva TaxID=393267 RepID=A0A4Q8ALI3_9MICO|nr:hypothetical protein [Microterricola gilva]RZU65394.1 hypothetical protein EV379_1727 [Microterricola gilva]